MHDILRISIYIVSFLLSAYGLSGVDFTKIMRVRKQQEIMILYFVLALALGYLVAQFLLGLSPNYYR